MRISDWSSDVCSSDLPSPAYRPWQCLYFLPEPQGQGALRGVFFQVDASFGSTAALRPPCTGRAGSRPCAASESLSASISSPRLSCLGTDGSATRSDAPSVGKECVSTCRSRVSPFLSKNKTLHRLSTTHTNKHQ